MDIGVVGCGYVGLTTGVGLALSGHNVTAVDIDSKRVRVIKAKKTPFFDPGIEKALAEDIPFRATTSIGALKKAAAIFICVGTPSHVTGTPDLRGLRAAAESIGGIMKKGSYKSIAIRSTVPPGTTERILLPIMEKYSGLKGGKDFGLVMNPEFLQEGRALWDFQSPHRIVIGQYDSRSGDTIEAAYSGIKAPVLRTDLAVAEMGKLASNAFLATKISFINEIGLLCNFFGIDTYAVADIMGKDPRIGQNFLRAGIGFGGSCLPKDLGFLISATELQLPLLEAVRVVNESQVGHILQMVTKMQHNLADRNIGVLGLAFKPGVSDVRESPAINIIFQLLQRDANVIAYDPMAMEETRERFGDRIQYAADAQEVISNSELVLLLTEWGEFQQAGIYEGKRLIDGRRGVDPREARAVCQDYRGLYW